jgi:hypothetical protein
LPPDNAPQQIKDQMSQARESVKAILLAVVVGDHRYQAKGIPQFPDTTGSPIFSSAATKAKWGHLLVMKVVAFFSFVQNSHLWPEGKEEVPALFSTPLLFYGFLRLWLKGTRTRRCSS